MGTTPRRASCAGGASSTRGSASPSRRRTASCWRTPPRRCSASPPTARRRCGSTGVKLAPDQSLEGFIAKGWIDGLQASPPEPLRVNGLPAVTAVAKADAWSFRLAAVRVGNDVYRLTFAAKELTPEADRRFRDSLDTFRRVTPEDARDVKPMRVSVAAAAAGDTVDAMASRMAVPDRPLEAFEVLNGLAGAAVEAGRRYKIVVE